MGTITKAEYLLKQALEKEELTLDKFPLLKIIVLKVMEEYADEKRSLEPTKVVREEINQAVTDTIHAKRLARNLHKVIPLVSKDFYNSVAVKEAKVRLEQYEKDHPVGKD